MKKLIGLAIGSVIVIGLLYFVLWLMNQLFQFIITINPIIVFTVGFIAIGLMTAKLANE